MTKPPRFKKAPGPSKLRLRMQANKQARQGRKVANNLENNSITKPGNIDIKSAEGSGNNAAMQRMVNKANNEKSLKDNFTPSKLQLKEEVDVKMQRQDVIPKLEHTMEAHNLARKNISTAFEKHQKDFNPDLVEYPNAFGGNTKFLLDPKSGARTVVNTRYNPMTRQYDEDSPVDFPTFMRDDSNKGALKAYTDARHDKVKKTFYESDAYKIWDEQTKETGMRYRAGGGDQSFSYSNDYQNPSKVERPK